MFSRLVYKVWFYFIYKLTFLLCIVGYLILIPKLFVFNGVFKVTQDFWMKYGLIILFYGVYFGVLGQDVAELCISIMATNLGVRILNLSKKKKR